MYWFRFIYFLFHLTLTILTFSNRRVSMHAFCNCVFVCVCVCETKAYRKSMLLYVCFYQSKSTPCLFTPKHAPINCSITSVCVVSRSLFHWLVLYSLSDCTTSYVCVQRWFHSASKLHGRKLCLWELGQLNCISIHSYWSTMLLVVVLLKLRNRRKQTASKLSLDFEKDDTIWWTLLLSADWCT